MKSFILAAAVLLSASVASACPCQTQMVAVAACPTMYRVTHHVRYHRVRTHRVRVRAYAACPNCGGASVQYRAAPAVQAAPPAPAN